jgi:hypothetical protein
MNDLSDLPSFITLTEEGALTIAPNKCIDNGIYELKLFQEGPKVFPRITVFTITVPEPEDEDAITGL